MLHHDDDEQSSSRLKVAIVSAMSGDRSGSMQADAEAVQGIA